MTLVRDSHEPVWADSLGERRGRIWAFQSRAPSLTQAASNSLDVLLQRDRIIVAISLLVITLMAWGYVLWLSANMAMPSSSMPTMDMSGSSGLLAPSFRSWGPADFTFMFAMWAVMMVGMMTPSVAPMVLLYAAAGRKAAESGAPLASTGWFFAGYLAVWTTFSALATFAQLRFDGASLCRRYHELAVDRWADNPHLSREDHPRKNCPAFLWGFDRRCRHLAARRTSLTASPLLALSVISLRRKNLSAIGPTTDKGRRWRRMDRQRMTRSRHRT